ncbi:hypothetical protein LTS18_002246, partial [Coniosporium uncinatum]
NVSADPPSSRSSTVSSRDLATNNINGAVKDPKTNDGQTNPSTSTKITIHGYSHPLAPSSRNPSARDSPSKPRSATANQSLRNSQQKEQVLLQLHPQSHTLASEWLDGLLMLLNQQPITADTNKLVNLIGGYGLKIRLLNVRFEDVGRERPEMPGREGVDDEFWFEMGGMEGGG